MVERTSMDRLGLGEVAEKQDDRSIVENECLAIQQALMMLNEPRDRAVTEKKPKEQMAKATMKAKVEPCCRPFVTRPRDPSIVRRSRKDTSAQRI